MHRTHPTRWTEAGPRALSRGEVVTLPTRGRSPDAGQGRTRMRSIFLWLIGIPLPIILLLAFCTHHL